MHIISKPEADEYAPYTLMYIDLVPNDGQVLQHLQTSLETLTAFIKACPAGSLSTPHADGEWTIKEILVHIIDDERIYCYRALRYARGDNTELPGFEQDDYVPYSRANERGVDDILAELAAVRQATITFFKSVDAEALLRRGVGSGNIMSVRAAAYHICGHEMHHLESIRANYFPDAA